MKEFRVSQSAQRQPTSMCVYKHLHVLCSCCVLCEGTPWVELVRGHGHPSWRDALSCAYGAVCLVTSYELRSHTEGHYNARTPQTPRLAWGVARRARAAPTLHAWADTPVRFGVRARRPRRAAPRHIRVLDAARARRWRRGLSTLTCSRHAGPRATAARAGRRGAGPPCARAHAASGSRGYRPCANRARPPMRCGRPSPLRGDQRPSQ